MDLKGGQIALPVDLIRTLAIVLVITLHAAIEGYPLPVSDMSQNSVMQWWTVNVYDSLGRFGVPLFVMLSGALLLQPSKLNEPIGVFFKKRLNRIALPFLFWSAVYFAWSFLANGEVFSLNAVGYGFLTVPYVHFWFLYLLFGLYLITPVLRAVVGFSDQRVPRYFLLLLMVGTAILPVLTLLGAPLNGNIFLVTGWIGYFLLGAYVTRLRLNPKLTGVALFLGLAGTIVGTYFIVGSMGEQYSQFFYDAFSVNIMVGSIAMFALLGRVKSSEPTHRSLINKLNSNVLVRQISQNILPIYLMFMLVLETLQRGYLGFQISLTTINPVVEVPLVTAVTLFLCLGAIVALKKIPHIKKMLG